VDIYRSYELWSLSGQLAAQEGDILDVGSRRHGTGCLMAFRVQSLRSKARVYLCDSLSGGAGEMDAPADSVGVIGELARRLELDNIEILHGRFPDDNARQLADRRFSLCHIDVDDYDFARGVTDWVWPRLCVGGSVVYDDYGFAGCDGITRLVNESIPKEGAIALHNLNGHAVFIKIVA
jgi:O-methyltransferase